MRRLLVFVLVLATLGYGGGAVYLRANEADLVYRPGKRALETPDARWALRERLVTYPSADGTKLSAWIIPAPVADSLAMWLLICHGQTGNIGYGERPEFYASARAAGLNLFAFDYRGFGASEGSPRETGFYDDALASYRFLADSLGVPPQRIIIFGHSLGSGVAIDLAARVPAAALVVEGAYTSIPDRAQEIYPYFPVKLIATQRFASIDKIARITTPKLLLHSPSDDIIPFAHGQRLFERAVEPKKFVALKGGHIVAFREDSATYFGALRALVDSLETASSQSRR